MKSCSIIIIKLFVLSLFSICFTQPLTAQKLSEKTFRLTAEAEVLLDLTASAPQTSWEVTGSEAAVATILVDGQYNQDIILFAGEKPFTYQVMLGHLPAGEHRLQVDFNRQQSASKATTIKILDTKISVIDAGKPEYEALSLAPIIYARPNTTGHFTDIPLLMWYEKEQNGALTTFKYSVIFTNEDGGTQTGALMARWGRTTDIEWIYEVQRDAQGKIISATYQGPSHETKNFQGQHVLGHPAFMVVTNNNNVSDQGKSEMRFMPRPIFFDLTRISREEIMDRNAWTYQVMAQELKREGRILETHKTGNKINDLREYLYIEAASDQTKTGISFVVKLRNNPNWYSSDQGINYYKIERSGYFRTTVHLPAGTRLNQIERIAVRCDAFGNPKSFADVDKLADTQCNVKTINKVFMMNEQYRPSSSMPIKIQPFKMACGEMIEVYSASGVKQSTR